MTGKQKRYLRSLAATIPPVVQIGKNGLENSVIDSARAALMARELIKVKLHNNSPEDKTIFQDLADMLGAELVQVIGFNGVLYKAKKKEPKIILPKVNRHITKFYYIGNVITFGLGG